MEIIRFTGGELLSNGYIVADDGKCYIIDTGFSSDKIADTIHSMKLKPEGVILTHHHYDHREGVVKLADEFNIPVFINSADMKKCSDALGNRSDILVPFYNGHVFRLGETLIEAIGTPGHTEGGVCLKSENNKVVFSGDTVFRDEIGLTNLEDGSELKMAESCRMIGKWDDDIIIYPGHGDSATVEYIRTENPEFKEALEMKIE